jgi:NADH:ubiquinone reductase (H+-translocating)
MTDVVVIGSGFAGVWSALGAARRLDELGVPAGQVTVTVLSPLPYHDIRVRNYEADISACRLPLVDILEPAGVGHVVATVTAIDTANATVTADVDGAPRTFRYDRLVLAAGSAVVKPASMSTPMTQPSDSTITCGPWPTNLRQQHRAPPWSSGPG